MPPRTHLRTCCLCEASCGLIVEVEGETVTSIRGDPDDPLSRGHVCPKAVALSDLHADPDRLRRPLRRKGRDFEEIDWETALDEAADRMAALRRAHGKASLATYMGNPSVHNTAGILTWLPFIDALGTPNRTSATSTDQLPRVLTSYLMYGHQAVVPVPDLDRVDCLVIFGGNPLASGGSLMTAPGVGDRLKALLARGGQLIVVDPRRTETAALATWHLPVRPGGDAFLLMALLHTLFDEGLADPGPLRPSLDGWEEVEALCQPWSPERAAPACGIPAGDLRRLARTFAASPRAAAYGRLGVNAQAFGGMCAWLVDLLNIATANLGREGGCLFPEPAFDLAGVSAALGKRGSFDTYRSRVRGLPEFAGEIPLATLAEEIETPGEGQVRGLITYAGNPALSAPDAPRLSRALASLDLMISIDLYVNETTRHADLILPPVSPLEREHYDAILLAFAVRHTARWSEPCFPPPPGALQDWQIIHGLWTRLEAREGAPSLWQSVQRRVMGWLGPMAVVDAGIRLGPYGDRYLPWQGGLSLKALAAHPHGVDLGPLKPGIERALRFGGGRIRVVPAPMREDLPRLEAAFEALAGDGLRLIGRRHLLDNNSWMHNSRRLTRGKDRCVLLVHPQDGAARGLIDGELARVSSASGEVVVAVRLSDEVRPGVVSLPHGYGHGQEGARLTVANGRPGVNANALTRIDLIDALSGNAALNGVPVTVAPAHRASEAAVT